MPPEIDSVKFPKYVKPIGTDNQKTPDMYIFGSDNPYSFRSVAYAVFDIKRGGKESIVLILKAKLGSIIQER